MKRLFIYILLAIAIGLGFALTHMMSTDSTIRFNLGKSQSTILSLDHSSWQIFLDNYLITINGKELLNIDGYLPYNWQLNNVSY